MCINPLFLPLVFANPFERSTFNLTAYLLNTSDIYCKIYGSHSDFIDNSGMWRCVGRVVVWFYETSGATHPKIQRHVTKGFSS